MAKDHAQRHDRHPPLQHRPLQHSILFVCLGNICRSPLAEGIFRSRVEARGLSAGFHIDSAGTGGWHVGDPPDPRSVAVAFDNGIDISRQRARQLCPSDYEDFAWLIPMDRANERDVLGRQPAGSVARVVRFTTLVSGGPPDVPDPYYGGASGFDDVYDLLHRGADRLLDEVLGT